MSATRIGSGGSAACDMPDAERTACAVFVALNMMVRSRSACVKPYASRRGSLMVTVFGYTAM
eukprot:scaffold607_cov112-Isochrysis_galbana.AAC.2